MGSLFIPQQKNPMVFCYPTKTLWFFGYTPFPNFFYQSQAANTKSNCPNWASQTACFATRILEAAQWQLAIKGGFSGETWML